MDAVALGDGRRARGRQHRDAAAQIEHAGIADGGAVAGLRVVPRARGTLTTPGMMRFVTFAVIWERPRSVDTMTVSSCLMPSVAASPSLIQHCCGATELIHGTLP